jgi:hypothetical protein
MAWEIVRRSLVGLGIGVVGLFLGWWLGDVSYRVWGPPDAGLESIVWLAVGAGIGGLAGILIGGFVVADRALAARQRLLLSTGALVAAGLAMAGLWWVGDLTNADGPGSNLSYLYVAMAPLSVGAYVVAALRMSRSARGRARRN